MAPLPKQSTLKQLHPLLHSNFATLGHAYKVLHISPATKKKLFKHVTDIDDDSVSEWFSLYQNEHLDLVRDRQQASEEQEESDLVLNKDYRLVDFSLDKHPLPEPAVNKEKLTKADQKKLTDHQFGVKAFHLLKYHFPEHDEQFLADLILRPPNWESHTFRKWYFDNVFLKSFPEAKSIADIMQTINVSYLKNNFGLTKLLSFYKNSFLKMFDDLLPRQDSFDFHPQDLEVGLVPSMEVEDMETLDKNREKARMKNTFKLPKNSWIFSLDFPLRLLRAPEWDEYVLEICARLEKNLKMRYSTEWVRIAKTDVETFGASRFGAVDARIKMLKKVHPEVSWNKKMFAASTKSNQRWVHRAVEEIFPSLTVVEEKQMELEAHGGKSLFEADVFVEELALAFEYQGEQHYHDIKAFFAPIEGQLRRDQLKSDAFELHGITLVHVPYWWDKSVESLKATVNRLRPDLIEKPQHADPIPVEPINMPKFVKKAAAMEPSSWDGRKDLSGWYWCEKYDGIRCISQEGKFYSKRGNEIIFPDWYADQVLPYIQDMKFPIDSELVCAQGYELMTTLVRLARNFTFEDREWEKVQLKIFDIVDTTSSLTFDERQEKLKAWYSNLPEQAKKYLSLVEYGKVDNNQHLRRELDKISHNTGGEGLIAVSPDNIYQPGRSRNSLKIKKYFDMEALYLANSPNAVAFEVELVNGERCQARCSYGNYYKNPYVPGSTVLTLTYTHLHQSTGKPFKPMVLRERLDLSWGEIKDHYSRVQPDYIELHSISRTPPSMDDVIENSIFVNTMKDLLQKESKRPSEMSDEEIRVLVGKMLQADPEGFYPTVDEKKGLSTLLSIQEGNLNQMIADARFHESPNAKVEDAKRRISEIMSSQDNKPPSRQQLDDIASLTNVTSYRLNLIVNELRDPPGEVNDDKREIIWDQIRKKKPFELVSHQELHEMKEKTQLNTSQVRRIIWFMKDRPGSLTEAKKETVRRFIRENDGRDPTKSEFLQLVEKTELNRMQVLTMLNSFREHGTEPVETVVEKDLIQWLEENNFRHPTDLEISKLEHETGVDAKVIRKEMHRLIGSHGTMTEDKKSQILNWCVDRDFSKPSTDDIRQLQGETKLREDQVKSLIEEIRCPPGRVDPESLLKVEESTQSSETLKSLGEKIQAKTGLGLRQAQLLLTYAKEGPGDISSEKKEQVFDELSKIKKLTASDMDKLKEKHALSRMQIYRIHSEVANNSQVTEEKKELIKQWLEANHDLAEFSRSELEELEAECQMNARQIYAAVEEMDELPGEMSPETKSKVLSWMKENISM